MTTHLNERTHRAASGVESLLSRVAAALTERVGSALYMRREGKRHSATSRHARRSRRLASALPAQPARSRSAG